MFEAAEHGGRPDDSRITKRCLICDKKCEIDKKLNRLSRWGWRPRTWINQAVILLSMLNIVFAHYSPQSAVDDGQASADEHGRYTREWAVHIEGGKEVADRVAAKHDFVNLGTIFEDLYHFQHKRLQKRSLTPHSEYHSNLMNEAEVKWAQQQVVKKRSKRDLLTFKNRVKFNDVEWPLQWYLNRGQGLDMNVQEAWQEGISGNGVVVTILDDGLEKNHPDLVANYDPQASYDVNNHDEDPMPRYDPIDSNRHGTRCAGEVAAVANNTLCSVGVAFGASVGGVRMLDGDVTDAVEARSLSLNPQHIDIYSASWGPDDDGKTVDGPGELATRAFIEGVTKGRQGKGSIFVWASGNGGREHDNCNCDGYTNSIWTLSISSATENGLVPWYSEACSSTLATTYSSGSIREKQIITTDLRHKCTNGHTGTSASAPLAAGICALALEANRDLTWRDMQHIVVRTAKPANLKSSDWKTNGVGRNVSHSFGYGLMDATAMVRLARIWKTVPEQHRCEVSAPHSDKLIPARSKVLLKLNVTECAGVNFLEHVQAKISLSTSRRGDLQIYLTSPAGTRSTLLAKRPQDNSKNPFTAWPFMSVHTWGEMPFGTWLLEIHNEGRYLGRANLQEWSLLFYGTAQIPTEEPTERPFQTFSPKSSSNKVNAIHITTKPNKSSLNSPNYSSRKNLKNWKAKSATSRIGKVSNSDRASNVTKVSPTPATKNSKTTQRFWYLNKMKDLMSRKDFRKTTSAPLSTHSLPLTIVLGPSGNFTSHQKVPDVFQKYPKVQQLFPLYVNSGRAYGEENFLVSKGEYALSYPSRLNPKSNSYLSMQKTERQNRFDTSSLTRTSTEGKIQGKQKSLPRKQQNQGHFEGWQMVFYGTEDTPNGDILPEGRTEKGDVNSRMKTLLKGNGNADDEFSNHLDADKSNRDWKDQATRRDEMTRTTISPLSSSSSGCALFSKTTSLCIECVIGLYLYKGRCEAICPPKSYPGVNAREVAACLPCHYTCLTCAGEADMHCTSCHDEAVPVLSKAEEFKSEPPPSSELKDLNGEDSDNSKPDIKVEEHEDDETYLSWGKRSPGSLVNESKSVLRKKAVTKKILGPYNADRPLFYCYPTRVVNELKASKWYYRIFVLFSLNLVILLGILMFVAYRKFCFRKSKKTSDRSEYVKMFKGGSSKTINGENILYLSSSSDEKLPSHSRDWK